MTKWLFGSCLVAAVLAGSVVPTPVRGQESSVIKINANKFRVDGDVSTRRLLGEIERVVRSQCPTQPDDFGECDVRVNENEWKKFGDDVCQIGQYVLGFTAVETIPTVWVPICCVAGICGLQGVRVLLQKTHVWVELPEPGSGVRAVKIVNLSREEAKGVFEVLLRDGFARE